MDTAIRDSDVAGLAQRFPTGFTWGFAASSYQVEGAAAEDGRGPSIWDVFCRQPGRVTNGDSGDVACDHYHRWRDDVALMAQLGATGYRFSVSWPRVLPAGTGEVNRRGLDFYDRLVDGLLEAGIRPTLNLYHWDLPHALQERGGWASPEIVGWFAEYATVVAERLGDRIVEWMTVNEPQVFAFTGHALGVHAPGTTDWPTALRVADHALRAHGAASGAIRAAVADAQVGLALDINHAAPATDSAADARATDGWRATRHRWFLDPLFGRGYPAAGREAHASAGHLDGMELTDPPSLGKLDFIGLNYYSRETIAADGDAGFQWRVVQPAGAELTEMGWQVAPAGLREVLLDLRRDYAPVRIIVSENGAAYRDEPEPDGTVRDVRRRRYLEAHLEALAEAIDEGVPVSGYYAWSLLDNFEWSHGYSKRFGLVSVDFASQRRRPKLSARWYQALIGAHRGP